MEWLALLAMVAAVAVLVQGLRRLAARRWRRWADGASEKERTQRAPGHDAKVLALQEWLGVPDICRAIVRSGEATPQGLQALLERAEHLSEREVSEAVARILRRRGVRLVVAAHLRRQGLSKEQVLRGLLAWASEGT